jgi:hypothetical protein
MTSACMGRGQGLDEEQLSRCFPKKLTLQRLSQRKFGHRSRSNLVSSQRSRCCNALNDAKENVP